MTTILHSEISDLELIELSSLLGQVGLWLGVARQAALCVSHPRAEDLVRALKYRPLGQATLQAYFSLVQVLLKVVNVIFVLFQLLSDVTRTC